MGVLKHCGHGKQFGKTRIRNRIWPFDMFLVSTICEEILSVLRIRDVFPDPGSRSDFFPSQIPDPHQRIVF
jgi:hypothetical protein